jgi:hypothetical protein
MAPPRFALKIIFLSKVIYLVSGEANVPKSLSENIRQDYKVFGA